MRYLSEAIIIGTVNALMQVQLWPQHLVLDSAYHMHNWQHHTGR